MDGNNTLLSIPAGGYASSSGNTWKWSVGATGGYLLTPSGSSVATLFLPASGYRNYNTGVFYNTSVFGYYWSSSVKGDKAASITFNYLGNANLGSFSDRCYAFSVRCVANQ